MSTEDKSNIEISIVPYRYKYLNCLIELHKANNYLQIAEIRQKTLPKIGYIAFFGETPIAAGFLRRVEGGFGQLDTLVSNPHFGSQIRHIAIDKVVTELLADAKVLNLEGIIAFTADLGVLRRAVAIGFKVLEEQRLIAFRL